MKKNKHISFLFFCVCLLLACSNKPNAEVVNLSNENSIPNDAIPFEYGRTKKIILKGKLNDSIHLKIGFDIGAGSDNWLVITDSLKSKITIEGLDGFNADLKIGEFNKNLDVYFKRKENLRNIDTIEAVMNWYFFKDKTIKISYQNKYIQVVDSNINKKGYESIKMKINPGGYLKIPAWIYMQEKVISEDFIFDTGCNISVYLENRYINKYSLNREKAQYTTGKTFSGDNNFGWLESDSVGIGNQFISNQLIYFGNAFSDFPALIGNSFLENFELILDFKNFILYLKPIKSE